MIMEHEHIILCVIVSIDIMVLMSDILSPYPIVCHPLERGMWVEEEVEEEVERRREEGRRERREIGEEEGGGRGE